MLDEDAAFEARLLALVRERAPGMSLDGCVRGGAHRFLDELERRPAGAAGSLPCLIQVSPTLRRAWLEALDRYAASLAVALADRSPRAVSPPVARVLAAAIRAVFAMIIDEVGGAMKSDASVRAVIKKLRGQVDDALERLAPALRSL